MRIKCLVFKDGTSWLQGCLTKQEDNGEMKPVPRQGIGLWCSWSGRGWCWCLSVPWSHPGGCPPGPRERAAAGRPGPQAPSQMGVGSASCDSDRPFVQQSDISQHKLTSTFKNHTMYPENIEYNSFKQIAILLEVLRPKRPNESLPSHNE